MENPPFKLGILTILALLLVFAASAEAFSVDVDHFFYQDPTRQISYDFSEGTLDPVMGGIILPASAIIQKDPLDASFIFMSPPDLGAATVTLDTTAGLATIQTQTEGGAILSGGSEGTPPAPSTSWTWDVLLKNFSGITEGDRIYRFYAGATAPMAPGPQPFMQGSWNNQGQLEILPMIYDRGTDTAVWMADTPVVLESLVPESTTLELRIENNPGGSGTVLFSYKCNGGVLTQAGLYTIPTGAVFPSLPACYPFVYLNQGSGGAAQAISFTGVVTDSSGTGIEGAVVFLAGNPSLFTTTGTGGAFTLGGLPVDSAFTLQIAKMGYADVFSAIYRSGTDVDGTGSPFKLFTLEEVAIWGIETGKGVITGKVLDKTSGNGIEGAVVSFISTTGQNYTVTYPGSETSATAADGRYFIPNVNEGDMVFVAAEKVGYALDARVFLTHGGVVSEGSVFGTTDSDVLALRAAFDTAMALFNAKNLAGFMAYVSEGYLDEGITKAAFEAELVEEFSDPDFQGETYTVLNTAIDGVSATMMVFWSSDMESELLYFLKEGGSWKIYGNQKLFEVMARSGYQAQSANPDVYWVSLEVEDSGTLITSVTVTGDGIDGSVALYHDAEQQQWHSWSESPDQTNNNPTFGATRPALPLTYTFTINYGTDQQAIETVTVTNFVEIFPANPSPAQGATVSGDLLFSWTPVPGFGYGIELFDSSWNQIWNNYDLQGSTVPYDGPALTDGAYVYNIVTRDGAGNYSILQTNFTYQATAPAVTTDVLYMRSANGYQIEMMLEGEVTDITSVTVTGPENSGIVDFPLNGVYDEFWAVYPSDTTFITSGFPDNYSGTYTFTATYNDQSIETFTFDFQPVTPLALPANTGINQDTGILSWNTVTGAAGYYLIIRSGQTEVYNGEADPLIPHGPVDLFAAMSLQGVPSGDYTVQVVAVDAPSGNEAYSDPLAFTYQGGVAPSSISFIGAVVDGDGIAVGGATVEMEGNPLISTTTAGDGTFSLSGLPIDAAFMLRIYKDGFVTTFSRVMRSTRTITSPFPFVLYTDASLVSWGVTSGSGVIAGRVIMTDNNSGIGGAEVTYQSTLGRTDYTVVYINDSGNIEPTGTATYGEGRYLILNVADSDRVFVSAQNEGFVFDSSIFMTHGGTVSEGIVDGTNASAVVELRNTFDTAMGLFNAKDLDGFMAYVSESYLDEGVTKAAFREEIADEEFSDPDFQPMTYTVLNTTVDYSGDTNRGTLTLLWDDGEREMLFFIDEDGSWKIYGDQQFFEVMAYSGYEILDSAPSYWVSLQVEDREDVTISSVTVQGDGIADSIALHHDVTNNRWHSWSANPQQDNLSPTWGFKPVMPLTYTFTVTFNSGSGSEQIQEVRTVNTFVEVFPMDQSPGEGDIVSGTLEFSWTPAPGYGKYGVELYQFTESEWTLIWNEYDIQGSSVAYEGTLEDGSYVYSITTRDEEDNFSLLQTNFTYALPGPVPSLGQAILVFKALTGQNPSGLEAVKDINNDGRIGLIDAMYVLQTNAGLITPLPVTTESGTAQLTSRAWNDNDGFDFSKAETKRVQIIDEFQDWQDTDFIVETNIIFLAPGVEAQDLGVLSLSDVNRVPIDGYAPTLDAILDPAHVYAFRLFDGTYAAIQFTEIGYDTSGDESGPWRSSFNYKYQPNWSANF